MIDLLALAEEVTKRQIAYRVCGHDDMTRFLAKVRELIDEHANLRLRVAELERGQEDSDGK